MHLTIDAVPPLTPTLEQGYLQKTITIRAHLLRPMHHIFRCLSALLGHPNIAQIIGGWEDNLDSHLVGIWSWRWHLRLGGWCVQYPWHTSPAGIVRSILPPQGQLTPTTTFHATQYRTPFWSPQSSNRVVSFLPCFVLLEFAIWRVGQ